jgi:hypothetical protein
MMYQLQRAGWKTEKRRSEAPALDRYQAIFTSLKAAILRPVLAQEKQPMTPFCVSQYPQSLDILYRLLKWRPDPESAAITKAVSLFYASQQNFHAAAGLRFETMVSQVNKRLVLTCPPAFFDWSHWKYTTEHTDAGKVLSEARQNAHIVETFFEEALGILWVLAMAPVARTVGYAIQSFFMPQVLDGASGWHSVCTASSNEEQNTKKSVNPAEVIRLKQDVESLIPSLPERLQKGEGAIYQLPNVYGASVEYSSPYFFKNGLQVNIKRRIIEGSPEFAYSLAFAKGLRLESDIDSILFIFSVNWRLFSCSASQTLYSNGDSICFQSNRMIVARKGRKYIITESGAVIFEMTGLKFISCCDGRIGRYEAREWIWVDASGCAFKRIENQTVPITHRHGELTDFATKITRLFREDGIKFTFNSIGDRTIHFSDDLIVYQKNGGVCISVEGIPAITAQNNEFTFVLDGVVFMAKRGKLEVDGKDWSIRCSERCHAVVNYDNSELDLTPSICQVKSSGLALYADRSGVQKLGRLIPDDVIMKRNIEVLPCTWGRIQPVKDTFVESDQVDYLNTFSPRFFAVRSDQSATEFIHKCNIDDKGYVMKSSTSDTTPRIVSLHNPSLPPRVVIEHAVLAKPARSALLKTLQITKPGRSSRPKKGEVPMSPEQLYEEACIAHSALSAEFRQLYKTSENIGSENEAVYREELRPKSPPPPKPIKRPVFTPDPRILVLQEQKDMEPNVLEDYWNSPEAKFVTPIAPEAPPRPPMRETPSFALPRVHNEKLDPPPLTLEEIPAIALRTGRGSARVYKTEVSRPQTGHSLVDVADFGDVMVGDIGFVTVPISNSGTKPLHLTVAPPSHPDVRFESIPQAVPPGLKTTIRLSVQSDKPQVIRGSFVVRTAEGEMPITFGGRIISRPDS